MISVLTSGSGWQVYSYSFTLQGCLLPSYCHSYYAGVMVKELNYFGYARRNK